MKKALIVIILAISMVFLPPFKTVKAETNNKVRVYLFWASWCSHCHHFLEYFADKYQEYSDDFEIVTYEVFVRDDNYDGENDKLYDLVRTKLDIDRKSVPLIVIGDWYRVGFSQNGEDIINTALEAKKDSNYIDVVASVKKSNKDIKATSRVFAEALKVAGFDVNESDIDKEKEINNEYNSVESRASIFYFIFDYIRKILFGIFGFIK